MNSLDDRIRSIRRYFAASIDTLGLADPFDWQLQRIAIADDERPAALIEAATDVLRLTPPRRTVPSGDTQQGQTFAIVLYPKIGESARVARLEAHRLAQQLDDTLTIGLHDPDDPAAGAPPDMIPLYDYDGVAVEGAGRAAVPEEPYSYLTVEDFRVGTLQDPLSDVRWSITATVRVSWWRDGRIATGEGEITSITPTWGGQASG